MKTLHQIAVFCCFTQLAAAQDWPQFRGPDTTNSTSEPNLPVEWSVETGDNIAWTADLPGNGVSTAVDDAGAAL